MAILLNKYIRLIHVAKRQLRLKDYEYRDILAGLDVESAADLDYYRFKKLMQIFKRLGFKNRAANG